MDQALPPGIGFTHGLELVSDDISLARRIGIGEQWLEFKFSAGSKEVLSSNRSAFSKLEERIAVAREMPRRAGYQEALSLEQS